MAKPVMLKNAVQFLQLFSDEPSNIVKTPIVLPLTPTHKYAAQCIHAVHIQKYLSRD